MAEKSNETISFRIQEDLKKQFSALVDAEGKNESAVLKAFIEQYVSERESFIASIASMFGYERTSFKEKRVATAQNMVDGDE